jgi:hypothetical protein
MIKEHELIEEGFERVDVLASESDNEKDYYHYQLELNDDFTLISDASDEITNNQWNVYCYEIDVTIKDIEDVQTLIALHQKWKKNS